MNNGSVQFLGSIRRAGGCRIKFPAANLKLLL